MCGIAGFVHCQTASQDADAILNRMMDGIAHRGPDGRGAHHSGPVHLGHLRLSIVDLAAGGQPMTSEEGRRWLVYNGEIFNHAEVRPELEKAGHRYHSRSDTETILHGWEEWGARSLERYRGMFAFALWDADKQTLFCARDRLGIKPFYYYWDGELFAFASEIKALLAHPGIATRFDPAGVEEYLAWGFLSGEATLFKGIRRLAPGHWMELDLSSGRAVAPRIVKYWDVPEAEAVAGRSEADWIAECRQRLEETVRMRLMSDVPLGSFLSGGVDSSAITALMARFTGKQVKTFSVGYAEQAFSELDYARRTAAALGTEHHEVRLGRDEFFGALPRLIWHEDEPIAWPSSVSLYFVSRRARQEVTVVLTGEGADELFGGYARYAHYLRQRPWAETWGHLPGGVRRGVRGWIRDSTVLSANLRRRLEHTLLVREPTPQSLYLENFLYAFAPARELMRNPAPESDPGAFWMQCHQTRKGGELDRLLYADQKTYLVELLMKQDQMSMATSIESRVPFLDHPFVEFAARVPEGMKIRNGQGKWILREAVRDLLPPEVLTRPKMGFPTPLAGWMLEPGMDYLYKTLLAPDGVLAECCQMDRVRALVEAHRAGREDATDRIWRLLNLQLWGQIFLTGDREAVFSSWAAPEAQLVGG
jgi:asparagine synthase (glutamine-hydrolysing)